MSENLKLKRLRELRALLVNGRLTDASKYSLADTDGRHIRLSDEDALAVLDRRIVEEGEPAPEPVPAPAVVEFVEQGAGI